MGYLHYAVGTVHKLQPDHFFIKKLDGGVWRINFRPSDNLQEMLGKMLDTKEQIRAAFILKKDGSRAYYGVGAHKAQVIRNLKKSDSARNEGRKLGEEIERGMNSVRGNASKNVHQTSTSYVPPPIVGRFAPIEHLRVHEVEEVEEA